MAPERQQLLNHPAAVSAARAAAHEMCGAWGAPVITGRDLSVAGGGQARGDGEGHLPALKAAEESALVVGQDGSNPKLGKLPAQKGAGRRHVPGAFG